MPLPGRAGPGITVRKNAESTDIANIKDLSLVEGEGIQLVFDYDRNAERVRVTVAATGGPGTDRNVGITLADTTPDKLDSKIVVTAPISKVIENVGGDERLRISHGGQHAFTDITGVLTDAQHGSRAADLHADSHAKYTGTEAVAAVEAAAALALTGAVSFVGINGADYSPGTDVDVDLITVNVDGTPRLWWDEATDSFEMNKSLTLPGGSLILGTHILSESLDEDDDGFEVIGSLHIQAYPGGIAGNFCLHEGTEPVMGTGGDMHRIWVDEDHDIMWQDQLGVSRIIHVAGGSAAGQWILDGDDISYSAGAVTIGSVDGVNYGLGTDVNVDIFTVDLATPGPAGAPIWKLLFGWDGWSTNRKVNISQAASGLWLYFADGVDNWGIYNEAGAPEGAVAADIGSLLMDTANGRAFVKTTDTENTGWDELLRLSDAYTDADAVAAVAGEHFSRYGVDLLGFTYGEIARGASVGVGLSGSDTFKFVDEKLIIHGVTIVGNTGVVKKAAVQDSGNWDTAYGWGEYLDSDAVSAVENEASLTFQQPTTISTKVGAGALTLATNNSLILDPVIDTRLKSDVLFYDNKKFWIGSSKDYWFEYNTSGSRLRFWTKNGDGGGTDMVWMRVLDGTINPQFMGAIEVDAIDEWSSGVGVTIDGVLLKDSVVAIAALRGLRETVGPTDLAMAGVADGQFLQRNGNNISGGGLLVEEDGGSIDTACVELDWLEPDATILSAVPGTVQINMAYYALLGGRSGGQSFDGDIGFYGATAIPQQTGVAVTDVAIHAALVNLGLIAA